LSASRPPRVALTGAGGFVGRRLAGRLAAWAGPGARLVALVRGSAAPEGFEPCVLDMADEAAVDTVIAELVPTHVVHLAAKSSVAAAEAAAARTWRTNVCGAVALATACARHAPDATVLCASSAEVYGRSFDDGPVDEDASLRPQNAYARSKAAAEALFADILPAGARLIVARPFNHSGAGQDERFVLPSFAAQIAAIEAGRQPPVMSVGNLDAERDFLHVDEVCDAYIRLLDVASALPARSAFNICSGTVHPIRFLLERMRKWASVPFEIRIDPTRLRASDIPRAAGRGDRLASATGLRPRSDIDALVTELLIDARTRSAAVL